MKKILLTICALFFVFASPLAAFEWGGLLTDNTGIQTPDFQNITLNQSNGISLWLNAPLGEDFSFAGEALYKYTFQKPKDVDGVFTNIADLSLLKIYGETVVGNGILSLNGGRFSYVDKSGAVVANKIDGLSVDYAFSIVKLGAFAGYSGLLNTLTVTGLDRADATKTAAFYDLAYGYAPVGLYAELPYLFGNQSLAIQGFAVIDCGNRTEKANFYYGSLALSGPVANSIYYSLSSTVGSLDFQNLLNYTSFAVMIFPVNTLSINLGVDFGSAFDGNYYYSPLSSVEGGRIAPKAGFTFGTADMCFDLSAKYIIGYSAQGQTYDASAVDSGSGLELTTGFVYNIFSDLQVGFSANAKIDTTAAKSNSYTANLNIALAF